MNNKHVFWQALLAAIIVFNIGVYLGYNIENSKVSKVSSLYAESELNLLDVRIHTEIYNANLLDCQQSIKENINFANRIYEEARVLDRLEDSVKLTESIKLQHKRYDLLRTLFWINSIKIKQQCKADYHNIVYFYRYNQPSLEEKAKQEVFSRLLEELKNKYADKIMLIPIAGDNNISSVSMLESKYSINQMPSILIDEADKITDLSTLEQLEAYLK